MRMKNLIVGAIVCASMLVAAPAFAQTATQGYSKPSGSIQERITTQHTPDPHHPPHTTIQEARSSSSLPFTGLDVALIVAAGGVLLAMGFGMRRLSRSEVA
ncbi:MAG: hypothetical protein QOE06_2990 [Thermoleophilaceae bacterium]|jgi:hypothetical protein|nr:hypothetical protein [Thermoleophilaceae bacterium]